MYHLLGVVNEQLLLNADSANLFRGQTDVEIALCYLCSSVVSWSPEENIVMLDME